jgi:flagellar FliL protein
MVDDPIFQARIGKKSGGATSLTTALVFVAVLAFGAWFWHHIATVQATDSDSSTSEVKTLLHLDSFIINLNSVSGNGYLRIGIDLGLGADLKEGEPQPAHVARVRDTILTVLATRSVEELLTPEGKSKLKDDLLRAIRERIPEIHCHEVYFTEFLVQH